jgi:hypothetical protein
MSIEIILCEFGEKRNSAGGAHNILPTNRLNPTYETFKKYFPNSKFTVYTDIKSLKSSQDIKIVYVNPPVSLQPHHPRYGWRCNDYYKIYGLLNITCDYGIAVDADMAAVSDKVKNIITITDKFGICFPNNPRFICDVDFKIGADAGKIINDSSKYCTIVNMSPITYKKGDKRGEILLKKYLELFLKNPCRGPNVASNSIWETGIYPYLLPFNWCICNDHINHKYTKNNEIILHVGQTNVFNYWKQNF